MKNHRYICIVCGRGFHAKANEIKVGHNFQLLPFDKKKCAMKYYGVDWKPGLFVKRSHSKEV